MTYTTPAEVKTEIAYNYQDLAVSKLTEDGFINTAGVFNEVAFLNQFISRTAAYIDGVLGGPFGANAVLGRINRIMAAYEVELYIISSQGDRVASVTLFTDYKNALGLLERIATGDLPLSLIPLTPGSSTNPVGGSPFLIEPINPKDGTSADGIPITADFIDEEIMFGTVDPDGWTP